MQPWVARLAAPLIVSDIMTHQDTKEQMVSIREKGGLSFPVSEGNRIFLNVVVNGKEKSHGKAINH